MALHSSVNFAGPARATCCPDSGFWCPISLPTVIVRGLAASPGPALPSQGAPVQGASGRATPAPLRSRSKTPSFSPRNAPSPAEPGISQPSAIDSPCRVASAAPPHAPVKTPGAVSAARTDRGEAAQLSAASQCTYPARAQGGLYHQMPQSPTPEDQVRISPQNIHYGG